MRSSPFRGTSWVAAALLTALVLRIAVGVRVDGVFASAALVLIPVAGLLAVAALIRLCSDRRRRAAYGLALYTATAQRPAAEALRSAEGRRSLLGGVDRVVGDLVIERTGLRWCPAVAARRRGVEDVDIPWKEVSTVRLTGPRGVLAKAWEMDISSGNAVVHLLVLGRGGLERSLAAVEAPIRQT
jgi:hypothetical protein